MNTVFFLLHIHVALRTSNYFILMLRSKHTHKQLTAFSSCFFATLSKSNKSDEKNEKLHIGHTVKSSESQIKECKDYSNLPAYKQLGCSYVL